jgi:hypothetical protein
VTEAARIKMSDVRRAGFCGWGLREFAAQHDLDLREFVKNGVLVSDVEHIKDANLQRVIKEVRGEE